MTNDEIPNDEVMRKCSSFVIGYFVIRHWVLRHSHRHRSPMAEAVVSKATKCEFKSHRCHSTGNTTRPRGAAGSARHPVTVQIVGSNPIGGAFNKQ